MVSDIEMSVLLSNTKPDKRKVRFHDDVKTLYISKLNTEEINGTIGIDNWLEMSIERYLTLPGSYFDMFFVLDELMVTVERYE